MTNIGTLFGQCGIVNSKENMSNMRNQLEFQLLLLKLIVVMLLKKQMKISDKLQEHEVKAPAAARKLESKACDITGITAPEIEAILYKVYNCSMDGPGKSKLRKADYVKALQKEINRNIIKYKEYVTSLLSNLSGAPPNIRTVTPPVATLTNDI